MILAGIAVKMLTADLYKVPVWVSPAFIAAVLAVVAALSIRGSRRRPAGQIALSAGCTVVALNGDRYPAAGR